MKLKLIMLVSLFAMGFAMSATAGNVADSDSDGAPDSFDNCAVAQNGPSAGACAAQEDGDGDGFGDACDGDYSTSPGGGNNGSVDVNDFGVFFASFTAGTPLTGEEDHNCDTFVDVNDFGIFFSQFVAGVPGP